MNQLLTSYRSGSIPLIATAQNKASLCIVHPAG